MTIAQRYAQLREEIPGHVTIVAAAKTCSTDQVRAAIDAGITHIGENYVQEGQAMYEALGDTARAVHWHLIGHLQKNKINKALPLFDTIQTVESEEKARQIDERVEKAGKESIDILLELNIGNELSKSGLTPDIDRVCACATAVCSLPHLRLRGIMTMGPFTRDAESTRPYFRDTRRVFDALAGMDLPRARIDTLSMGMSHSYKVAIEEGSTMVRLGTTLLGPR